MAPIDILRRSVPSPFNKDGSILSRSADGPLPEAKPWLSVVLPESRSLALGSPKALFRRATDDNGDSMINLLLIVLGLVFLGLVLASLLFFLQRRRRLMRQRAQGLPLYDEKMQTPNRRGLTIETSHHGRSSILYIGRDGEPMLQNPMSPPDSPDNVPEIRITFPDEQDEHGRSRSGRVLVVRVGDNATVGLEPMHDEQLPAYEKDAKGQFQSIDMDQIGGLREKDRSLFQ